MSLTNATFPFLPISRWQDPEELLISCRSGPGPSVALMHANFGLAMVALAENRQVDAKKYFNDVKKGRQYMMYVHMLSRAILTHADNWDTWHAKRQEMIEK